MAELLMYFAVGTKSRAGSTKNEIDETAAGIRSIILTAPPKSACSRHNNESTVVSKPSRERLLWAVLSLVLPTTFGDVTTRP